MVLMVSDSIAEHEYVVQVDVDERSNILTEDGIHQPLEGRRSVAVTLLHHQALKYAEHRGEVGLPHVPRLHWDLFVGVREINFRAMRSSSNIKANEVLIWERRNVL